MLSPALCFWGRGLVLQPEMECFSLKSSFSVWDGVLPR